MTTRKKLQKNQSDYNVDHLLQEMSERLTNIVKEKRDEAPVMVGIHTAGVWIAKALHKSLKIEEPLGELNINFYRDDFSRIGLHPQIQPSNIPFNVENKHLILVDDVLYTGRTIRAAMNELFDFGRPASITLVVLIDRGNRELPIEAQVVGFKYKMDAGSYFKLSNTDDNLELEIIDREQK
ncbi:MAG: bifunctional pyr operon transcriptional regulator/uracil phosphoribosyltransferase PyrR [Cocleimonas sp.]